MSDIDRVNKLSDLQWSDWKRVLKNLKLAISQDHLGIVSAGVAFYAFLAIFPALISLISLYGLVVDPEQARQQIQQLGNMMPDQALGLIEERIEKLLSTSQASLSWGTALGVLVSIWSANRGTKSLFKGIEIVYDVENHRNFFKQLAITLGFTFAGIITVILTMVLVMVFPALVKTLDLPTNIHDMITWLRWPLLVLIVIGVLMLIYRYAPDRRTPHWKWILAGATLATLLWLLMSWGFSYYVSNFGNYGEIYGAISAVVVLMLWLFLSSFIVLLGAEVNSELEYRTAES